MQYLSSKSTMPNPLFSKSIMLIDNNNSSSTLFLIESTENLQAVCHKLKSHTEIAVDLGRKLITPLQREHISYTNIRNRHRLYN